MAVAVLSLYSFSSANASSSTATFSFSQSLSLSHPLLGLSSTPNGQAGRKRRSRFPVVVKSTHSNAKVLKSNRRSRFGQALNPSYDSDEEEEVDEDDDGDDDDDGVADVDWLLDDEFAEPAKFEVDGKKFKSQRQSRQGNQKHSDVRIGKNARETSSSGNFSYGKYRSLNLNADDRDIKGKMTGESGDNRYQKLSEEIDLDKKWLPLLDYLSTFGLKESHFIQMYERHMPSLQINACNAQERLDYLFSVGVKHRDIKRILLRQPQILEYTVDKNLKPHVGFLRGLGIPSSKIGQTIAVSPSLFSYSVENSLKPTVRYLVEEVGIDEKNIGKVVQLSPQILVQRIDISWNTRYLFLSKELGASRDSVVKMVTKHPQLLHYSIDDGLLPRINFLRSIGMRNSEILKVLTSLAQVLSLSLEDNLKPKYMYLINELCNEVQSLTKYPMYLSLSLDQRIRPRHRYLVALKKAPKGPFPLSSLVPTDECFCQQWAGTSVDKYLAFRQQLLLKDFAKKYER